MCDRRSCFFGVWLFVSVFHMGLGGSSISLGVLGIPQAHWLQKSQTSFSTPIWSGMCFLVCGLCGILCAKKRTGLTVRVHLLYLLTYWGILNVQFLCEYVKWSNSLYSLHLAFLCLASLGMLGFILSTWLTCRLASWEQKRLFLERDLSLHHSVEMDEKCSSQNITNNIKVILTFTL
uniref:Transmembrane protein 196 n=1 Tax=Cyprinus carpio TaxID=7962 RepID=A0A8C2PSQ9_CYPCA